jgi:hypothetical protein
VEALAIGGGAKVSSNPGCNRGLFVYWVRAMKVGAVDVDCGGHCLHANYHWIDRRWRCSLPDIAAPDRVIR